MTDIQETMQQVWEALASNQNVLLLCLNADPSFVPLLFSWLRALHPTYESSTEMCMPNGAWLVALQDSEASRQACARAKKDDTHRVIIV